MRPETETELSLNDETGQKMLILRLHWDSHWSLLPPLMGRRMIYMPWKEFYFMWVRLVFLTFRANSAISSWSSLFRFPLFGYFWLNYSQDFNNLWILRKRLINTGIYDGCRDRELSRLRNFSDVETKTHRDWEISLILRLRLIKTENFLGCRDQDSSRLRNFLDVETKTHQDWKITWMSWLRNFWDVKTETHQDWEISGMSRPRLIETGKFDGCRDRDHSRLGKRCRYRDSIKTLADICEIVQNRPKL